MPASIHDDPPMLVCADLQTEYLTEGRRHVISDAEAITSRCLELMTLWRDNLWPVMHLKRIAQAAWFNPASNLTDWIAELKPQAGRIDLRASAALGLQLGAVCRIHVQHRETSAACCSAFPSTRPCCRPWSKGFTAAIAIRSSAMRWHAGAPASAMPRLTSSRWSKSSATSPAFCGAAELIGAGGKIAV